MKNQTSVSTPYLFSAIFISGGAVLAIEILGTRILGPFYGVSLFLWSALISVTLVALSIGYAVGGRWADKGPTLSRLCCLMLAAGVWMLLIPWVKSPILKVTEPIGLRFAVLVAAAVLFMPPLTLLGMISPYAIRLRAFHLNDVGRTAGDIYAVSTIGSVIAALATGYFLIPNLGVKLLTLSIGLVLAATASAGFLIASRSKTQRAIIVLATVIGAIIIGIILTGGTHPEKGLLAVEQSPYGELRVIDENETRYMLIDGGTHTIANPETFESYFPYVHVLDSARNLFSKSGDMLLIGLGGGSVVKQFASQGWRVDAVEIDSKVVGLAKKYFGLTDAEARIFVRDGRRFLTETDQSYDLIILDAFGSSSIPFHLVTEEAFGLIKQRLRPRGVFALNLESVGWRDKLVRSLAATLNQQFDEVLALPIAEPPNTLGNLVLLASNREFELLKELPPTRGRFSTVYHKNHAWDNSFAPDTNNVPVLTDDLNPVGLWSERINLASRKALHEYFDDEGLSW